MTVGEAQARINSAEFSEWIVYNSIDPFTYDRTESMLAMLCAVTANANRTTKSSKLFQPGDFLPNQHKKVPDTQEDIYHKLRLVLGGNNK